MTVIHDENTPRPAPEVPLPIVTGLLPAARTTSGSARWAAVPPPAPRRGPRRAAAPAVPPQFEPPQFEPPRFAPSPYATPAAAPSPYSSAVPAPSPYSVPAPVPVPPPPVPGAVQAPAPAPGTAAVTALRGRAPAGTHRDRRPGATVRRAVLGVTAALLAAMTGIAALGIVGGTPGTGGEDAGPAAAASGAVDGVDGLYPGGPPHRVPVVLRNRDASAFEVTDARPDLDRLPAGCPASAWSVSAPAQLPTVPAHAESALTLPVALAADAPQSCQAIAVRLAVRVTGLRHPEAAIADRDGATRAGGAAAASPTALTPATLDAEAAVTTATLGTPGTVVTARDGLVVVRPVRPTTGPGPDGYQVSLAAADGALTPLCTLAGGPDLDAPSAPTPAAAPTAAATADGGCVDGAAPAAAERRYVVTGRLGSGWSRGGTPVRAWTAPPVPGLSLAAAGAGPAVLTLRAAGAATGYQVALVVDGAEPFRRERVPAEGLEEAVPLPPLAPGAHRLVATAQFHGWRASSGALEVAVAADGSVVPGRTEAPPPVTAPPATTPAASTAPATTAPAAGAGAGPGPNAGAGPGGRSGAGTAVRPHRTGGTVRSGVRRPTSTGHAPAADLPRPEAPHVDPPVPPSPVQEPPVVAP